MRAVRVCANPNARRTTAFLIGAARTLRARDCRCGALPCGQSTMNIREKHLACRVVHIPQRGDDRYRAGTQERCRQAR
jgi:hypothetical protein